MKRVVVVGGGLAGHRIAHALQGREGLEVVLVEPRDHWEVPMVLPRALVRPGLLDRAHLPLAAFLPRVRHVRGWARAIRTGAVEVEGLDGVRHDLRADRIVIAVGARYRDPRIQGGPPDATARRRFVDDAAARVAEARRVLVVGGGAVGVEVAAELAHHRPDLAVTLAHAGERLLGDTHPRAHRAAVAWLSRRGVSLRLGVRVDAAGATAEGTALPHDVRIDAVGSRPRGGDLGLPPGAVDARGRVRVGPTLAVDGLEGVYAVGDVTDLDEVKLGMWAGRHAGVVTAALTAWAADAGGPAPTYRPRTGDRTQLVTLGPRAGTGHVPWAGPLVSWVAWAVKSRDLMVGRYRRGVGLDAGLIPRRQAARG